VAEAAEAAKAAEVAEAAEAAQAAEAAKAAEASEAAKAAKPARAPAREEEKGVPSGPAKILLPRFENFRGFFCIFRRNTLHMLKTHREMKYDKREQEKVKRYFSLVEFFSMTLQATATRNEAKLII
jgi:hypothetical protein